MMPRRPLALAALLPTLLLGQLVSADLAPFGMAPSAGLSAPMDSCAPIHPCPDGLVYIAPGSFTMGSAPGEPGREPDEGPQHHVTLTRGFWVGRCEVTQEQYAAVMEANPACFEGARRPVEQVSWFDAIEFCNRLSDRQGLRRCYSGSGEGIICDWEAAGYRLPTEAEWEFACRAGSPTAFSVGPCLDPFGPDAVLESVGWYIENARSLTHDVAEKERNAWGLHDVHGNVWEWCWDWYGSYPVPAQTDPLGLRRGTARVVRGGSWFSPPKYCRSAFRSRYSPELRHNFLGFRVVRGG